MNVNQTAFLTITSTSIATIGCVLGAVTVANTVATVALAAFALIGSALSIAAITAWFDVKSEEGEKTPKDYFKKIGQHAGFAIVGVIQFVTQTLIGAMVRAIADEIGKAIGRKFFANRQIAAREPLNQE